MVSSLAAYSVMRRQSLAKKRAPGIARGCPSNTGFLVTGTSARARARFLCGFFVLPRLRLVFLGALHHFHELRALARFEDGVELCHFAIVNAVELFAAGLESCELFIDRVLVFGRRLVQASQILSVRACL